MTRDPEMRYTPKGTAVAAFGLAVNRRWKTESGEEKEEVTFVDCSAFGRTAEVITQYFKKGSPIFVEGRLKLDQWEDKQSGQNRQKLQVIVEGFQFVGGTNGGSEGNAGRQQQSSRPKASGKPAEPPSESEQQPGLYDESDDVPF